MRERRVAFRVVESVVCARPPRCRRFVYSTSSPPARQRCNVTPLNATAAAVVVVVRDNNNVPACLPAYDILLLYFIIGDNIILYYIRLITGNIFFNDDVK